MPFNLGGTQMKRERERETKGEIFPVLWVLEILVPHQIICGPQERTFLIITKLSSRTIYQSLHKINQDVLSKVVLFFHRLSLPPLTLKLNKNTNIPIMATVSETRIYFWKEKNVKIGFDFKMPFSESEPESSLTRGPRPLRATNCLLSNKHNGKWYLFGGQTIRQGTLKLACSPRLASPPLLPPKVNSDVPI